MRSGVGLEEELGDEFEGAFDEFDDSWGVFAEFGAFDEFGCASDEFGRGFGTAAWR